MLAALCETGTLKLTTRYALQKGMLIDVGTALVPNAVQRAPRGRAVFRLHHRPGRGGVRRRLRRAVPLGGHGFLPHRGFHAGEPAENRPARDGGACGARGGAAAVYGFVRRRTRPTTSRRSSAARTASRASTGLRSACFRLLSEEKLRRGVGALSGAVRVQDGALAFVFPDFTVTVGEGKADREPGGRRGRQGGDGPHRRAAGGQGLRALAGAELRHPAAAREPRHEGRRARDAHDLHGQPRHRQDDDRAARLALPEGDGRADGRAARRGHARRPSSASTSATPRR